MKKIIALYGKPGTRLDEAMEKILTLPNVGPVKQYTNNLKMTRGKKYTYFLDDADYIVKVSNGEIIEARVDENKNVIGSWLPGGHDVYVGVFSRYAIEIMQSENINQVFALEIRTKDDLRLKNLIKKYGAYEAARRFLDESDWEGTTYFREGFDYLYYEDNTTSRKFKGLLSLLDNFVK